MPFLRGNPSNSKTSVSYRPKRSSAATFTQSPAWRSALGPFSSGRFQEDHTPRPRRAAHNRPTPGAGSQIVYVGVADLRFWHGGTVRELLAMFRFVPFRQGWPRGRPEGTGYVDQRVWSEYDSILTFSGEATETERLILFDHLTLGVDRLGLVKVASFVSDPLPRVRGRSCWHPREPPSR